jgi:GPH family glycoside/pentoside/hexuronide:cation symporter
VVALLSLPSIWWRGAVNGLAAAGTTLLSISMLPDIMEYDRIKTGLRREGIFSGIYTIVEKLGFAPGAAITGAVLSFSGYIPTRAAGWSISRRLPFQASMPGRPSSRRC